MRSNLTGLKGWIYAAMFCVLTSPIFAASTNSPWFARAWQTYEGLPDDSISGVVQTEDGFLWIGTLGGLIRFDGEQFEEFSPENITNVSSRVVRTLALDRRNRLWLGMDRGQIVCVESNSARVFTGKDGLPEVQPVSIVDDADGATWIGNSAGAARIKDGVVTRFGSGQGLAGAGACGLSKDHQGRVWFVRSKNVGVFRDGHFQVLLTLPEAKLCITSARDGGLWIGCGRQILRFMEGREPEPVAELPVDAERRDFVVPSIMLEDSSGAVWIGTWGDGLFRMEGSRCESVPASYRQITTLLQDREGNIWVGTRGGGLNRLRPRTAEVLGAESGLPMESVGSLTEDDEGALWVVTQDGSLTRLKEGKPTRVSAQPGWPGGHCVSVTADRQGAIWIGTRGSGLIRYQDGQFKVWRRAEGLVDSKAPCLLASSVGDVWVASDSASPIQRLRNGELKSFPIPRDERRPFRAMTEDAAGNIWAATSGGQLLKVSDEKLTDETAGTVNDHCSIRALHATPDGSVWIGYAGRGLGRLKAGRFALIDTTKGLHENHISQIMAGDHGWLWMAGNRGIFRVRLQELIDVAEGRAAAVRSIVFGAGEGLPSLQPNFDHAPSAWRSRDGSIWLATRKGAAVVHPERVREDLAPPPMVLKRVAVDDQTVALYDSQCPLRGPIAPGIAELRQAAELRLRPAHRKIDFDFAALSFTASENVTFRRRLDGFDQDWIEMGRNHAIGYSRLSPGKYVFHAAARSNAGEWNELGGTIAFTVAPFLWQTWWFQAAVLVMFTSVVVGIARYISFRRLRLRLRVLENQAALEKERTRIARDLHDDLGSRLTKIALLSELALEHQDEPVKAGESVQLISTTARQVIKSLDETVWAVNPRNDTLPHLINYIGQFAVEFLQTAGMRCRVDLLENPPQQAVSTEVRHHVFLTVKEALNNVVRHASAREVWLRTTVSETSVSISIEDDGQGFAKVPDDACADGLRNMRQRMEEIGGRLNIESRPGAGTRITLTFPWSSPEQLL